MHSQSNATQVQHLLAKIMSSYPKARIQPDIGTQLPSLLQELSQEQPRISQFLKYELTKRNGEDILSMPNRLKLDTRVHEIEQLTLKADPNSCYLCHHLGEHSYNFMQVHGKIYMFNRCFVPPVELTLQITVFMLENRLDYFLSYIQLCTKLNKPIKIISPTSIWIKLLKLLRLVWGQSAAEVYLGNQYQEGLCRVLSDEQIGSFDFESSSIIMKRNLWPVEAYDLCILLKGDRYIVESSGVKDEEILEIAWRKDIVSESEYCRLIDKTTFSPKHASWVSSKQPHIHELAPGSLVDCISAHQRRYINFLNCELFLLLPDQIVKEAYQNGQTTRYSKSQIVYKAGMKMTKFYVVLEGQLMAENSSIIEQMLNEGACYSHHSLIGEMTKQQSSTLICQSEEATIFSIDIILLRYIFSHHLQILKQIQLCEIAQDLDYLSIWTRKTIQFDSSASKRRSKRLTKSVGNSGGRIQECLWKKLCRKDLRIMLQTESDKITESQ